MWYSPEAFRRKSDTTSHVSRSGHAMVESPSRMAPESKLIGGYYLRLAMGSAEPNWLAGRDFLRELCISSSVIGRCLSSSLGV